MDQDTFLFEKYKKDLIHNAETIVMYYSSLLEADENNKISNEYTNDILKTDDLDEVIRRIILVRKAMSLVNKMKAGPVKARHKSKVFSNLNKINSLFKKMTMDFEVKDKAVDKLNSLAAASKQQR